MLLDNVMAFQLDFSSRRLPFTCDDARRITTPALVFAEQRSTPGLQLIAETLAGCLNEAKFVRIRKATHRIPHDQPQKSIGLYSLPSNSTAGRSGIICREAITKLPRWAEFFDRPEIEWAAGTAALALQGDERKNQAFLYSTRF